MKKLFLFFGMLLIMISIVFGADCGTTPSESCEVNTTTTFATGTYHLGRGIDITASGVTLDCNNSVLDCNTAQQYKCINVSNNLDNIVIKNCIINRSGIAMYFGGGNYNNIDIHNNDITSSYQSIELKGNPVGLVYDMQIYNNNITHDDECAFKLQNQKRNVNVYNNIVYSPNGCNVDSAYDWNNSYVDSNFFNSSTIFTSSPLYAGSGGYITNFNFSNNNIELEIYQLGSGQDNYYENVKLFNNNWSDDTLISLWLDSGMNAVEVDIYNNIFYGTDLTGTFGVKGGAVVIYDIFGNSYNSTVQDLEIYDNEIYGNGIFVGSDFTGKNLDIHDNYFDITDTATLSALYVLSDVNTTFDDNYITNIDSDSNAVYITGNSDNVISGNNFTDTSRSILLDNSDQNIVSGNYFSSLVNFINYTSTSDNNQFNGNFYEASNCTSQVVTLYIDDSGTGNTESGNICNCGVPAWYCSEFYCETSIDEFVCTVADDANSCETVYFGSLGSLSPSGETCDERITAEEIPYVVTDVLGEAGYQLKINIPLIIMGFVAVVISGFVLMIRARLK